MEFAHRRRTESAKAGFGGKQGAAVNLNVAADLATVAVSLIALLVSWATAHRSHRQQISLAERESDNQFGELITEIAQIENEFEFGVPANPGNQERLRFLAVRASEALDVGVEIPVHPLELTVLSSALYRLWHLELADKHAARALSMSRSSSFDAITHITVLRAVAKQMYPNGRQEKARQLIAEALAVEVPGQPEDVNTELATYTLLVGAYGEGSLGNVDWREEYLRQAQERAVEAPDGWRKTRIVNSINQARNSMYGNNQTLPSGQGGLPRSEPEGGGESVLIDIPFRRFRIKVNAREG